MRSRRRSTPWIHRNSRLLIGAIAILGALDTAYLTIEKLTGGKVVCLASAGGQASSSCTNVLSSPYATVFGLPLALFGCLAYCSMVAFALAPMAVNSEDKKDLRSNLDNWTWLLLFAGATAMTVFSGYLMYLLAFVLKSVCYFCIASALFSLSLFVLTLIGRAWEDEHIGQLFFTGIVVGMVALISTLGLYSNTNKYANANPSVPTANQTPDSIEPVGSPKPGFGWEITHTSGADEITLASHLKKIGAKMYGAYWCPHCYEQKQLLGKEAFHELNYIECAPDGPNAKPDLCVKAGIQGFPTWNIKGKVESGVQSPQQLADLSGYTGSRNFKYSFPGR